MKFVKKNSDLSPIKDTVFAVASLAAKDKQENGDLVIDATIGSLFDENGSFVAFHSVFDHYDQIDHRTKGAYASSFRGNPAFQNDVYEWVTQGTEVNLPHAVIATPGGSGAVSAGFMSFPEPGDTVLIPEIGWESYALMARQNHLNAMTYALFEDDHFNLNSIRSCIDAIRHSQEKIFLVINDPCHNPTGYSLSDEEWSQLTDILNEVSKTNPVILINDIAYLDFSYDLSHCRSYMNHFNKLTDRVLVLTAFSCSKALTSYGLRCGAAIIFSKTEEAVQEAASIIEKVARSVWSNIPNAAMANFSWVTKENRDAYLKEKKSYIDLLKKRSDIILHEADECGLPLYPYKEGFFITIRLPDPQLIEEVHQRLIEKHIYTVTADQGIRLAVCSLPVRKATGLAKKIKEVMDEVISERK